MSEQNQKRMSGLLVLSLALNIFIAGWWIGGAVSGDRLNFKSDEEGFLPPIRAFVDPHHLVREADPETRTRLRQVAKEHLRDLHPKLEEVHSARKEIHELMRQDPLDREAIEAAVRRMAEAERDAQLASSSAIIEMLEELSPEERARLLAERDKLRHRGPGRRDRSHWRERYGR